MFILDWDKFPNKGGLMRCLPGCLDNKRAIGSAPALPQYQTNSGQDGFWMKLNATPFPPYLVTYYPHWLAWRRPDNFRSSYDMASRDKGDHTSQGPKIFRFVKVWNDRENQIPKTAKPWRPKLGPLSDQWYDFALLFHILVSMALLPGSLPHSLSHNVVFVFRFDRRDSTPCHDLQTILFW